MTDQELRVYLQSHDGLTMKVEQLLQALLNDEGIRYSIESRTKIFDSLKDKIVRKNIQNIREELTDLSGLRIILYYKSDIEKVEEIIKSNFLIDNSNSIDKATLLEINEFGYLSVHYIAKINAQRANLPEWKIYKDLKMEIQVRTILQHAWASISHEISYKKKQDLPRELGRKLSILAGLFELADDQFEIIKNENGLILNQYEASSDDGNILGQPITFMSINALFNTNRIENNNLIDTAIELGFIVHKEKEDIDEEISQILFIAKQLKLKTNVQLVDQIRLSTENAKSLIMNMVLSARRWTGNQFFITKIGLLSFLSDVQMDEFSKEFHWNNSAWHLIKKSKNLVDKQQ